MPKTRELASFNIRTGNIAGNTILSVDATQPITDNLIHYAFSHSNEFDFGLITGAISIDRTEYEDWGSIE